MDKQSIIASRRYIKIGLVFMLLVLLGSIGILAWVPPVSRDALTHHLAVPRLWLQYGSICEIPSVEFSYYPMNLDLLYLIPLYFGNDIAPKYIHYVFGMLTAALIFVYLKKRLDTNWALFGVLFFISLPIIVKLSITVYVDLGLVFFTTASLISLLKWIESRFQLKFLLLSAVNCGLALGTKYNGLIVLFILTLFIPFLSISRSKTNAPSGSPTGRKGSAGIQLKALGYGAIFFAVALLVFSPWMIRNFVWKANPVYPLYGSIFERLNPAAEDQQSSPQEMKNNGGHPQPSRTPSNPWSPFAVRKVIYGESWWEIVLIPFRIFFQGLDDNPKYFDGQLNPFLMLLPFFAFVRLKKNPLDLRTEKKVFVFFSILYLLYAFSTTVIRIRYVAPIIPPLVILATFGLHQLNQLMADRKKNLPIWMASGTVIVLMGLSLALNAAYVRQQFRNVDPLSYISGRMSRDAYISKYRPEHSVYLYANHNLPNNAKILGLFLGKRLYYSEHEIIFGLNEFKRIVDQAESDQAIIEALKQNGFTFLIIRFDLFNRWTNSQFDDRKKLIVKNFFDERVDHIFSANGYGLYQLKDNDI